MRARRNQKRSVGAGNVLASRNKTKTKILERSIKCSEELRHQKNSLSFLKKIGFLPRPWLSVLFPKVKNYFLYVLRAANYCIGSAAKVFFFVLSWRPLFRVFFCFFFVPSSRANLGSSWQILRWKGINNLFRWDVVSLQLLQTTPSSPKLQSSTPRVSLKAWQWASSWPP